MATNNLQDYLANIATAIRNKKGTTNLINPQDFAKEIMSIEGGGGISQRVSYLRRTNIGYIDTGIKANNPNLSITVRFAFKVLPTGYWYVVRAYENESSNATRIICNGNKYIYGSLNTIASSSASVSQTLYKDVIYTVKLYAPTATTISLSVNGVSSTTGRKEGTPIDKNLEIFSDGLDLVDIELYSLEIVDNGVLVRDFIPHYQDGEFGLWDVVGQRFYGNSGGGTFGGQILNL